MEAVVEATLRALLTVLKRLPPLCIRLLADVGSLAFVKLPTEARERAYRNIERVYGLPAISAFATAFQRQWTRNLISCTIETLQAIEQPERIEVSGFSKLKQQAAPLERSGKSVIFVTSHLGSWELCAYFAGRACDRPLHVLAKPPKRMWAKNPLQKLRSKMLVEVLWTDSKNLLKDMIAVVKKGESLGFVMDQKPDRRQGPVVNFFNQETPFVGGPAMIALRFETPVIGIHVVRTGPFRYHIHSEVLIDQDNPQNDETAATQIFATYIEKMIRLYPEQWTWNYKRWRAEPASPTS